MTSFSPILNFGFGFGLGLRLLVEIDLVLEPIRARLHGLMADCMSGGGQAGVDPRADLRRLLPYGGGGEVLERGGGNFSREVELRGGAAEVVDGGVVGTRRRDRGGVGAEPDPGPLVGLPYLRHPLPPLAHPYALVGLVAPPPAHRPGGVAAGRSAAELHACRGKESGIEEREGIYIQEEEEERERVYGGCGFKAKVVVIWVRSHVGVSPNSKSYEPKTNLQNAPTQPPLSLLPPSFSLYNTFIEIYWSYCWHIRLHSPHLFLSKNCNRKKEKQRKSLPLLI